MKASSWDSFLYFLRMYPRKSAAMITAMSAAGLMEGVGLAVLLPLIMTLTGADAGDGGALSYAVHRAFDSIGIELTVSNILIFIVFVMSMKAGLSWLAARAISYTSSYVSASLRREYMRNLLDANWLHYIGLKSGGTAHALGMEAERSAFSFRHGCQASSYIFQILVYGILACIISWQLTIAAFATGGLLIVVFGFMIRGSRAAGRELAVIYNRTLALITDTLLGSKPLKAMNKSGNLFRMVQTDISSLQTAQRKIDLYDLSLGIMSEPLMVVVVTLGLFGALTYTDVPVPQLLFMAVVFLRMVMRITSAQRSYQAMASSEHALGLLLEKIEAARNAREPAGGALPGDLERSIVLDKVSFAYGEHTVFEDMSLTIPARRFTLFLGPSGVGKTTMLDLVVGLHQPRAGRILVDGVDLAGMDKAAWRSRIGYVPQDVLLFHDTILQNITLSDESLTRADAEAALAKAGALDFVLALESGLDTVVGERGARLSGGQRQRIAIARALVHRPQLIILDEATSALDPATEQQILRTVKDLTQEVTVVSISHNPALAAVADTVYLMAGGNVQIQETSGVDFIKQAQ